MILIVADNRLRSTIAAVRGGCGKGGDSAAGPSQPAAAAAAAAAPPPLTKKPRLLGLSLLQTRRGLLDDIELAQLLLGDFQAQAKSMGSESLILACTEITLAHYSVSDGATD